MPSFDIDLNGRATLRMVVNQKEQQIANNRTRFEWSLRIIRKSSGWWTSSSCTISFRIGGTIVNTKSISGYNFGNYTELLLDSGSYWAEHLADGSLTAGVAGVWTDPGGPLGSGTVTGQVTFTTIPRATTAVWADQSTTPTAGATKRLNLPRASTSFTHDVTYKIGSKTGTIGTGLGAFVDWAIPEDLMTEFPDSAWGLCVITTVTKNGATTVGTRTSNSAIYMPAYTLSTTTTVTDINPNTSALGVIVQGASILTGQVAAVGVYGSTITDRGLTINSAAVPVDTPFTVDTAGTVDVRGHAVDSRGRPGLHILPVTVAAYQPPRLGSGSARVMRANSSNVADAAGQYLRLELHAIASSLIAGTEKNGLTIKIRTRPTNGAWTPRNTITTGITHNAAIQISGGAAFLVTQSYEVEVSLEDNTGIPPQILILTVSTASVTLDMNGVNVGVGKYWERGALDVAGDIYAAGVKVSVEGHTHTAAELPVATQAETDAGTSGTVLVTPATLANFPRIPKAIFTGVIELTINFDYFAFPEGLFTEAPKIMLQLYSGASAAIGLSAMLYDATKDGFQARHDGASAAYPFHVIAIEM